MSVLHIERVNIEVNSETKVELQVWAHEGLWYVHDIAERDSQLTYRSKSRLAAIHVCMSVYTFYEADLDALGKEVGLDDVYDSVISFEYEEQSTNSQGHPSEWCRSAYAVHLPTAIGFTDCSGLVNTRPRAIEGMLAAVGEAFINGELAIV